jgi:hypothetical protein
MSHTPGPWVGYSDDGQLMAIMPSMRSGNVCTFTLPPSEADGRLMVAAPDLLAALKALKVAVEESGKMNGREYISLGIQINNALAKAG